MKSVKSLKGVKGESKGNLLKSAEMQFFCRRLWSESMKARLNVAEYNRDKNLKQKGDAQ